MQAKSDSFVAYYRVSTDRQGRSGLGLDAQREAVRHHLASVGGTLTAEFVEVESGKRNNRPELQKALSACRRHKARLIIAKLDRLSRNVAFIATMMDAGVEFVACDNPHATRLTSAHPGRRCRARAGNDRGPHKGCPAGGKSPWSAAGAQWG